MKRILFSFSFLLVFIQIALGAKLPDLLVLKAYFASPQKQYQQFLCSVTLKNIGDTAVKKFNVAYLYFSKDTTLDSKDIDAGFVSLNSLNPGDTINLSVIGGANQFGNNADSNYKYIIVKADARSELAESNENNNLWRAPVIFQNANVDLTVNGFTKTSPDTVKYGDIVKVGIDFINKGTDMVQNAFYEFFLSADTIFDSTDTKTGYLYWIGFDWKSTYHANVTDLSIPSTLTQKNYYLFLRINAQGQEIYINDVNPINNVVKLCKLYANVKVINSILNFDEDFGTRSWTEDNHSWSWDNTGWDNVRNYFPHAGAGHGMSAPGYSAKLSSTALLNVKGLWLKTSSSYNFDHLKIIGYGIADTVIYTQSLNAVTYEYGYAYVTLNWQNVKSIQFDYSKINSNQPADILYDDMDYTFLDDNISPVVKCIADQNICASKSLPDYRKMIVASDNSGQYIVTQSPAPGTQINQNTTVTIEVKDGASNKVSCSFNVIVRYPKSHAFSKTACQSFTLNNQTYTSSGLYIQTLSSTFGCDSNILLNLTIDKVDASVQQDGSLLIANDSDALYQWVNCSNHYSLLNCTTKNFQAEQNGNYAVIVSKGVCEETSSCYSVILPDNLRESTASITAFPNPNDGNFVLKALMGFNRANVKIRNELGLLILDDKDIYGDFHMVNISNQPSGIYFIDVIQNGVSVWLMIIKD